MKYLRIKDKFAGINVKLGVLMLLLIVLLMGVVPRVVRAENGSSGSRRNMFYVQVLNYTMPIVKSTSFDEEDMVENRFSIAESISSFLGVNTNSPLSIIAKEIPFINSVQVPAKAEVPEGIFVNPFKLNEAQVQKEDPATNDGTVTPQPNDDNMDLPDNKVEVYDPSLKSKTLSVKPQVFIYHTHTCESYSPGPPDNTDQTKNVVAVGDALEAELEKNYGITVVHDKTVHDAIAYNQSYARSGETVDKYLKKYGDFKLIIDLHRDSIEDKRTETIKLNGVNTAKFMFVMARKNPHFSKNDAVATKLIAISNKLFPGLCKGVFYYNLGTRYFNQAKSNNAVLMEVGSDINTSDEAKNTSKYAARIIAEYLNGKN